ncbi:MAG: glycosyltransferase family 4 protein [Candidatus Rokubacteria bacterium]|nr:glycosyltransferase family 4 protein [Candidatus Rokubacteria bacterium]
MKLAIICRAFVFHGGLENATAGLIGALVRQKHEVHLFSTRGQQEIPGVRLHRLPVIGAPSLARIVSFALAAKAAVSRERFDVVQSHERTLVQDVYRAGEGCHRAYLEVKAKHLGALLRPALWANPSHRALLSLERKIFSPEGTRRIVAISRLGKAEIQRLYGFPDSRVSVIYNGVDQERFHPADREPYRAEVREALGVPQNAWVVLFVGSGFERKGLGPLIEGFALMKDRASRLVVVGKGNEAPYRAWATRLGVAERVSWLGPRADIERYYAAADAVALPALYEPFGNVHLEALASGLPVLASSRAGGSEVVSHGKNGWILDDPEDVRAIREGLLALRDGGQSWRDVARAAAIPFTFEAQARFFADLYRSLGPR